MKKILSIVLALALVFGFAGMTLAMGPDGADPATVGLVLTSFNVSDSILSPLMMMNWSGTLQATKTYAEGQPIWFVASYVQNKTSGTDSRNFTQAGGGISSLTTVFTSKDNCVNYSYSSGYMNFTQINNMQVVGGTVGNLAAPAGVSATAKELEVTFQAIDPTAFGVGGGSAGYVTSAQAQVLGVANATANVAGNYYLQIMAFTNPCTEAQGTAIAKMPIDTNELSTVAANIRVAEANVTDLGTFAAANTTWVNVYDANNAIKYRVAKFTVGTTVANIGAASTDNLYMVYGEDGAQIIGFVSSATAYKGMVKFAATAAGVTVVVPVQYNSDAGGKYVYTATGGAAGGRLLTAGDEAVSKGDLEAVMTFFNFSFGNSYPVLDKHINALAGYWKILEAKYNVAAAVISVPDPGVDIVPKTGDVSSAFGMIMVAIAGLAAVGFVMMKRVHG